MNEKQPTTNHSIDKTKKQKKKYYTFSYIKHTRVGKRAFIKKIYIERRRERWGSRSSYSSPHTQIKL
jgi:hypothetical protein